MSGAQYTPIHLHHFYLVGLQQMTQFESETPQDAGRCVDAFLKLC